MFDSASFSTSSFSAVSFDFGNAAIDAIPSRPHRFRYLRDGIAFDIAEDDEEIITILAAVAPLLNRRH